MPEELMDASQRDEALKVAATPRERALLLGLDFEVIERTGQRLRLGSLLVLTGITVAFVVPIAISEPAFPRVGEFFGVALLTFLGYFAVFLSTLALVAVLAKGAGILNQQIIGNGLAGLTTFSGLLALSVFTRPVPEFALGALFGAALAVGSVNPLTVLSMRSALRRYQTGLEQMVRQYQALPKWQTLLGGQIRWSLGAQLIDSFGGFAFVALAIEAPTFAAASIPLIVISSCLAVLVGWRDRRVWSLLIQAAPFVLIGALAVWFLAAQ